MIKSFSHMKPFNKELIFKGDKSVSHRALILAAMAEGESIISNLSGSDDVKSTISCLRQLGVEINLDGSDCKVAGKGFKGFRKPDSPLEADNSGTTARLLAGLLAAQDFESEIRGDESLSKRPMDRIIDPLRQMGAVVKSSKWKLPLRIYPSNELKEIFFTMKIPSAQVKSSVILAGLHCDGISKIREPVVTRNHTESMLGLPVEKIETERIISFSKNFYPRAKEYKIPGDLSSAAFFIVLTLLTEGASLSIHNILLNNTRTGIISLLKQMGGKIEIHNVGTSAGEEYGDLHIQGSKLKNVAIPADMIPGIIDEIPILTVAGLFAEGDFEIRHASELRIKESDRIRSLLDNLHLTDVKIREYDDGFILSGHPGNKLPVFDSFDDHRIAMTFIILSCLLKSGGSIFNPECISVSNPEFLTQLDLLIQ